jgi:phenylacetate-coenzyme A ligase PaaK-like adenylate-forming protein
VTRPVFERVGIDDHVSTRAAPKSTGLRWHVDVRGEIHRTWRSARGSRLYRYYDRYLRQLREGIPQDTTEKALGAVLRHAVSQVPYYSQYASLPVDAAPFEALRALPFLDKATIREQGENLYSRDLPTRKWTVNTSGGSTGEPVRIIQDQDYLDRIGATGCLYSHLLGLDPCQPCYWLWGSPRDILRGGRGIVGPIKAFFKNSVMLNAFEMTEAKMRNALSDLDRRPPRLIVAYARPIYELARFAERNAIPVHAQNGIVSTAGTLYPFMRETIERVFQCPVFNQYGSREVGSIACEVPGSSGLWIAPWNCYVEVIDSDGSVVCDGTEGEIVVTCLSNFAMPLIRYRIGDRGSLLPRESGPHPLPSQILEHVNGRTVDAFRLRDGTIVDGCYVIMLLFFHDWIKTYQVIQKREDWIVFRFVIEGKEVPCGDWEEICSGVRKLFGPDCRVDLEIVDEIHPLASGKYRYTISEVGDGCGEAVVGVWSDP